MMAVAVCGPLWAETIYAPVGGYVRLGATGEGPAVAAGSDVYLTLPLVNNLALAATVNETSEAVLDSETGEVLAPATIRVSGAPTFGDDEWASGADAPFGATITTGAEAGLRVLIIPDDDSNPDGDLLTVEVTSPGLLSSVAPGERLEIRPCWTLGRLFEGSGVYDNCKIYLYEVSSGGINKSSSRSFIYFSGTWYNGSTGAVSNDTVLHPGETFVFRSGVDPIEELRIFGAIPRARHRADLSKNVPTDTEDLFVSHSDPIPVPVGGAGGLGLPAENNDKIYVYDNSSAGINKSSSVSLIYFSGSWYNGSTGQNVTETFLLEPGRGFVLRRSSGSDPGAAWARDRFYPPAAQ